MTLYSMNINLLEILSDHEMVARLAAFIALTVLIFIMIRRLRSRREKLFKEIEENAMLASVEELERYQKRLCAYRKSMGSLILERSTGVEGPQDTECIRLERLVEAELIKRFHAKHMVEDIESW